MQIASYKDGSPALDDLCVLSYQLDCALNMVYIMIDTAEDRATHLTSATSDRCAIGTDCNIAQECSTF